MKPKMKFRFLERKHHGVDPMNILEIYGVGLGWKSKYGMLEYEEDPYIEITLFRYISLHIDFIAPKYANFFHLFNKKFSKLSYCFIYGIYLVNHKIKLIFKELTRF